MGEGEPTVSIISSTVFVTFTGSRCIRVRAARTMARLLSCPLYMVGMLVLVVCVSPARSAYTSVGHALGHAHKSDSLPSRRLQNGKACIDTDDATMRARFGVTCLDLAEDTTSISAYGPGSGCIMFHDGGYLHECECSCPLEDDPAFQSDVPGDDSCELAGRTATSAAYSGPLEIG
eukprot:COSAG02_NODE_25288_length_663_cov_0.815603_1_plen_175_part_01